MMQATATNNSHHSSSTQLSQLPSALTARILQRVPLKQRLTCCSLVCRTWRDAAAQATLHIECSITSATVAGFEAWLRQPGQQVQTLKVTGKRGDSGRNINLVLPWDCLSRLQSLNLTSISLSVSTLSSNSSGSTTATAPIGSGSGQGSTGVGSPVGSAGSKANNAPPLLPHLRELQLCSCTFQSADVLAQLASNSPQLTSLVVEDCFTGSASKQTIKDMLPAVLKQFPGLVVLRLPLQSLSAAAARCVAAMHSLRELQLGKWEEEAAPLPNSLTRLNIGRYEHCKLPTQLPALTQLLHLHLRYCMFPAAALASMPRLQHLHLFMCRLLAPGVPSDASDSAGTADLLAALRKLTQLQHLDLQWLGLCTNEGPPQQWSALTASTQLTHLYVVQEGAPLAKGAARHMFPAGRRLPQLQELTLLCVGEEDDWCLTGADLASIIAACPKLEKLDVSRSVREGEDLAALLQLPASCSRLEVGGDAFGDEAVTVVKSLTQLRSLRWDETHTLTDVGVLGLADLTGLTSLELFWCYPVSSNIWEAAGGSADVQELCLEASDTEGPVWQQLLSICQCSPECGEAARERLMAAMQDLRRQLAASQAQVQQLADAQAQLADAQAQVQRLQQQLAAAGAGVGGVE